MATTLFAIKKPFIPINMVSTRSARCKNWCFTLNNYALDDVNRLTNVIAVAAGVSYLVFGFETGNSGTPHLQGYIVFDTRRTLRFVRDFLGFHHPPHLEAARGTPESNRNYCIKDGDFREYGTLPQGQGRRTDFEDLIDWIQNTQPRPTESSIMLRFPGLYFRYRPHLLRALDLLRPHVPNVQGDLRPWQQDLEQLLLDEPDDRTVNFLVDPEGASGKTWFCRYWLSQHSEKTQILRVGKRDDLAHCIDTTKTYFFFDVPRGQMEFFQYAVPESIKDQMVFSPKYNSIMKYFDHKCYVVIFCNEMPSMTSLSVDRYNVVELTAPLPLIQHNIQN